MRLNKTEQRHLAGVMQLVNALCRLDPHMSAAPFAAFTSRIDSDGNYRFAENGRAATAEESE